MQILRIILMVCFVFTAYTPIGEAVDIEIEKMTAPAGENDSRLHVESVGDMESKKSEKQAGEPIQEEEGLSEPTHFQIPLNERILQLQKKELDKSLATPTEDDGDDGY